MLNDMMLNDTVLNDVMLTNAVLNDVMLNDVMPTVQRQYRPAMSRQRYSPASYE